MTSTTSMVWASQKERELVHLDSRGYLIENLETSLHLFFLETSDIDTIE
jgi:hypothetical protein